MAENNPEGGIPGVTPQGHLKVRSGNRVLQPGEYNLESISKPKDRPGGPPVHVIRVPKRGKLSK